MKKTGFNKTGSGECRGNLLSMLVITFHDVLAEMITLDASHSDATIISSSLSPPFYFSLFLFSFLPHIRYKTPMLSILIEKKYVVTMFYSYQR